MCETKSDLRLIMVRHLTRCLALFIMISVLAGCGAGGKLRPGSAGSSAAHTGTASVTRLEEGRQGFAITENPKLDADARRDFDRAVAKIEAGDYEEAIGLLEKVIERSPGVTAPYINIAIACKHIDRLEEAERHLKTALDLVPAHPVASNEYALLLRKSGRFAEAREIYEKTLATFPDYHPAHRNLGILCDLYLTDPECALEHYEIYSEAMPDDQQVKMWIADLRLRLGR